jgi:hypothetical protein
MITIFKTAIENKSEVDLVTDKLNNLLPTNTIWNFDLEYCDKTLRIDSRKPITELISISNLLLCIE